MAAGAALGNARAGPSRWRCWVALALLALATVRVVQPMAEALAEPGWPAPDEHQAQLEAAARMLQPVARLVPEGEPLVYVCALDERGARVEDLDRWFDLFQAVLAPRRIGREVEARHALVHFSADQETPELPQARVQAELAPGLVLVERTGP